LFHAPFSYRETGPCPEPGIRARWQRSFVGRANAVVVIPFRPGVAIQHRHAALRSEPDAVPGVDGEAVHPLVDQFFLELGEFHRIEVDTIGAVPGAYPVDAIELFRKRVNPVIGEPVHREEYVPLAILVPRSTSRIGAEPLVTLAVDADRENVFVRETVLPRKGIAERVVVEADFHHAHGCTDPERARCILDRQRAHVDAGADLEPVGYRVRGLTDARILLATTSAENNEEDGCEPRRQPRASIHRCRVRT
jgi:hypothetical protein